MKLIPFNNRNTCTHREDWIHLGAWHYGKVRSYSLSHVRGLAMLLKPPMRIRATQLNEERQLKIEALFVRFSKLKIMKDLLVPKYYSEPYEDVPEVIWLVNQYGSRYIPIRSEFYDILTLVWPKCIFRGIHQRRHVLVSNPGPFKGIEGRIVGLVRPIIVEDLFKPGRKFTLE